MYLVHFSTASPNTKSPRNLAGFRGSHAPVGLGSRDLLRWSGANFQGLRREFAMKQQCRTACPFMLHVSGAGIRACSRSGGASPRRQQRCRSRHGVSLLCRVFGCSPGAHSTLSHPIIPYPANVCQHAGVHHSGAVIPPPAAGGHCLLYHRA